MLKSVPLSAWPLWPFSKRRSLDFPAGSTVTGTRFDRRLTPAAWRTLCCRSRGAETPTDSSQMAPDDIIITIQLLAANSPSLGRPPCSSPAWSAAAGSRPATSAAAENFLLPRVRPQHSATPSGRRTPLTTPAPPAAG